MAEVDAFKFGFRLACKIIFEIASYTAIEVALILGAASYGSDDECFFYIEENPNGSYTVEGECYIITNKESLKHHKTDIKKEVKNKPIWYYHIDKNGTVISKEKQISS